MEYVIGFVALLGVLIFVHEFGHFIVAKALGVKVLKFSLGFPPALIKRKWGETEYVLSAIPLGGYVKLLGEDPESDEEIAPEEQHRAFTNKPLLARMAIIVAGPLTNFLLAVVLLSFGHLAGLPVLSTQIGSVVEDHPAYEAGFQKGDTVVSIDGADVSRWDKMQRLVESSEGKKLDVVVDRNGEKVTLQVAPILSKDKGPLGNRVWRIGVTPSGQLVEVGVLRAFQEGWYSTIQLTRMVLKTLVMLVKMEISAKALSGPITIAQASGESLKQGVINFIFLLSFISVNLAIINLLPIPILDGGHLLFFCIEAIIRRPVTGKVREVATHAGLLFIIFLMVLVFYNDISRIITKGWSLTPEKQVEQPVNKE